MARNFSPADRDDKIEKMGFGFTQEQERFRTKVRAFVEQEIKPRARETTRSTSFPQDLWRQIGEFGLLGIDLPEEYGGQPGDCTMRGIVAEELGRVDLSLAFTLVPSYGTSLAILCGGSKEQSEKWIPGLIKGDKLGSIGMTEPDCGSDLSLIRTKARKEGDYYVLNGEKSYVSWGLVADVNWIFARTERDANPQDMTCFLIPLDLPGIAKSSFPQMGLHSAGHSSLCLEDVRIPVKYRLGEEGRAFLYAAKVFPQTRMILALSALGLAQISLEEGIGFARQRAASGQPLAKLKEISLKIAEDATLLEAARWLCYGALRLLDQGERCAKEIAMSKWWCTEVALRVIHNMLLIHGHSGYGTQYPLEQRLRDIIGYEIAEATPQILKLTICEEILGKELRPFY